MTNTSNTTPQTYAIQFSEGGKVVQQWQGYLTKAEARAAIRDADRIIPMSWAADIVAA